MKWKVVKLGEICEINMGKTPSRNVAEYWNGKNPWVAISDLKGDLFISTTKEGITDLGIKKTGIKPVPKNTLLYSFKLSIGKVAITQNEIYTNEAIVALPIKDNSLVDLKYLYWAVQVIDLTGVGDKAVKGITLNKEKLKSLQIPLPPISTQRRIAEILDKADALRRKDRELLAKYDELAQSIFIDMFGDPVRNEKGWGEIEITNCCIKDDDIRCGPFGTQLLQSEFVHSGVPLWGIRHTNAKFKIKTHEFLTHDKAEELKNYSIVKGDIVMTRKGTIGNCSVYEFEENGVMHSDLLRIRVDKNICNPYFLSFQLQYSQKLINQIEQISHGAIMSGINVSKLKSLKVLFPGIKNQNLFQDALSKINLSTSIVNYSKSGSLFQSLLQKAFKGELTP